MADDDRSSKTMLIVKISDACHIDTHVKAFLDIGINMKSIIELYGFWNSHYKQQLAARLTSEFPYYKLINAEHIVGIIEHSGTAIGFIQFYTTKGGEYHEFNIINKTDYKKSYGIDIVVGEKKFWNKGIGTQIMLLVTDYLYAMNKINYYLFRQSSLILARK